MLDSIYEFDTQSGEGCLIVPGTQNAYYRLRRRLYNDTMSTFDIVAVGNATTRADGLPARGFSMTMDPSNGMIYVLSQQPEYFSIDRYALDGTALPNYVGSTKLCYNLGGAFADRYDYYYNYYSSDPRVGTLLEWIAFRAPNELLIGGVTYGILNGTSYNSYYYDTPSFERNEIYRQGGDARCGLEGTCGNTYDDDVCPQSHAAPFAEYPGGAMLIDGGEGTLFRSVRFALSAEFMPNEQRFIAIDDNNVVLWFTLGKDLERNVQLPYIIRGVGVHVSLEPRIDVCVSNTTNCQPPIVVGSCFFDSECASGQCRGGFCCAPPGCSFECATTCDAAGACGAVFAGPGCNSTVYCDGVSANCVPRLLEPSNCTQDYQCLSTFCVQNTTMPTPQICCSTNCTAGVNCTHPTIVKQKNFIKRNNELTFILSPIYRYSHNVRVMANIAFQHRPTMVSPAAVWRRSTATARFPIASRDSPTASCAQTTRPTTSV